MVSVPIPRFQFHERVIKELAYVLNGGSPETFKDGIAKGPGQYRGDSFEFFVRPMTWGWSTSELPDKLFKHWKESPKDLEGEERPGFMGESEGRMFAPGLILHPRRER